MQYTNREFSDHPVNWDHWLHLETLTANQAAQLMVSLDPHLPASSRTSLEMRAMVRYATAIYRLALDEEMTEAPMSHWLEWGNFHEIHSHPMFVIKTFEWKSLHEQRP